MLLRKSFTDLHFDKVIIRDDSHFQITAIAQLNIS